MADWKVVMDAVGDSAIQVLRLPPKIAVGCAEAAKSYAGKIDRRLAEIETGMPARPEVLVSAPLGAIADTIELVGEVISPVAAAVGETARGISTQVEKIGR